MKVEDEQISNIGKVIREREEGIDEAETPSAATAAGRIADFFRVQQKEKASLEWSNIWDMKNDGEIEDEGYENSLKKLKMNLEGTNRYLIKSESTCTAERREMIRSIKDRAKASKLEEENSKVVLSNKLEEKYPTIASLNTPRFARRQQ